MRIGSLFSGYGGLDMGVMSVLGGSVAWHVEFDEAPSRILAHHWPDVPNYGDVTAVDWAGVEPVDVLTGGFPCQDVSLAGRRAGMKDGTRSGLWSEFARAIDVLRPGLVVIENVRGLLSASADSEVEQCPWCVGDGEGEPCLRALGAVLGDLADLGYDAQWCGLRAGDAGAPHGRFRVFIVAFPAADARSWEPERRRGHSELAGTPGSGEGDAPEREWHGDATHNRGAVAPDTASLGRGKGWAEPARFIGGLDDEFRSATTPPDADRDGLWGVGRLDPIEHDTDRSGGADSLWREYEPAIRRWEYQLGRVAPSPTVADGRAGNHRLNARFVEWMMGLSAGHVTDSAIGLTRSQQLKALGNGVVPQQAALALHLMSAVRERMSA